LIISLPQLSLEIDSGPEPVNLLSLLGRHRVPLARSCGGDGVCGTCRLRIEGKDLPAISGAETKLAKRQGANEGERFACLVEVPASSKTWALRCDYW